MRRLLAFLFLSTLISVPAARAQYMFLDSNGDGASTSADRMNANGAATTMDVWIKTDLNRDGSPGVCPTGDGALTINSYVVNLAAVGGNVTYSAFTNRRPEMGSAIRPFNSNTTEMTVGQGGSTSNPPGTYLLMTITITGTAGSPSVAIVRDSGLQAVDTTNFGSQCSGNDFDNTLKLGSDWLDTDGLGSFAPANTPPVIAAPATASGSENSSFTVSASASDPDAGQLVTLSQTNDTGFLPSPTSSGAVASPANLTLSGTPSFNQAGSYTVNWTATDNAGTPGTAAATTAITIANLNRVPVITAPATVSGTENTAVSITGSATDPDAQTVTLSQTNTAPFLAGPASAGPVLNPSITLTGTPNFSQAGSYTVNWMAVDSNTPTAGTSTASTAITIANLNRTPVITAPATASGQAGTSFSVTGSATDPDGQNVTLSQTNNASFLVGPASAGPAANTSITLTGTPGSAGSFTVNWSANDGAGGTATAATAITIVPPAGPDPVLTTPATVSGTESTAVSITGSASDVDGQNVTLSQTNTAPFLAGPASAGPALNPSITLTGTPNFNQAGSYTINWTAVENAPAPAGTTTATTTITIVNLNRNPDILAPATVSGTENTAVSITGSASDPDGQNVTLSQTNNAPFLAGPASAGPAANPSITLTGTPNFSQAGNYTVNWSANDGAGGTFAATTAITMVGLNRNPVITAPSSATGTENSPVSITGSASDPDGDNVTLSQANNAAFLTGPASAGPSLNPSITLTGTPSFTQAGSYTVNWSANDGVGGTAAATTALQIVGQTPRVVITAPASVLGSEGASLTITASAVDAAATNVTLFQQNNCPFFPASSSSGPSLNPSLTVTGTPAFGSAGTYTIAWTAVNSTSPAGTATASTTVTIAETNRPPSLDPPLDMTVNEGETDSQQLTASDPDNDPLSWLKVAGPLFMGLSPSLVTLSPGYGDAGSYTGTVRVTDPGALFDEESFAITVVNVNRCPSSNPGGPYTGVLNAPVNFDGTASSDPDGDLLTYTWGFGDGGVGSGAMVSHVYTSLGTHTVTLTVNDGACPALASTTATITDYFDATAFTAGGNSVTSLGSGKPFTCVQVQPFNGHFDVGNVDLATIKMISMGTGSVSEIPADAAKTSIDGDRSHDGIQEIRACFAKADLRNLFSGLPGGSSMVTVTITGSIRTGGAFSATLTTTVKSSGGALAASISPNPLNPSANVVFVTSRPGAVRIQVFDLNGRLARTLRDEAASPAGWHEVAFDGRSTSGQRLTSGIYFVKIRSEFDGEATKSLTILK